MSGDWWEAGYSGGPMVKVPGFPRPLYPPDAAAHGKRPSVDGPDVIAYKRTVSRAGRWPWQTFDESYSNGFAHGTGGNVVESGIEGVQRQQKIDATGWIGESTFNTLRSIRVPEGKPHAGEMAMDPYAANLVAEAWDIFGGAEPPPIQSDPVRLAALELARGELGYVEASGNRTKYGDWYGMDGQPWCAMFVTWAYELAAADIGRDSPSFVRGARYAYCPYVVDDARNRRYGLSTTDDPIPGDLVVFDWSRDTVYDHIGLFERAVDGSGFEAIEGNTSPSNNSNGGQVMRRTRDRYGQGTVFIRVAEPEPF